MNYSSRGAAAIAEMSPFSRPAAVGNRNTISSGWRPAAAPMTVVSGDGSGNLSSSWQRPSYPLVGFDAGSFISQNKVAVAIGAAVLAGGLAYYYGYR